MLDATAWLSRAVAIVVVLLVCLIVIYDIHSVNGAKYIDLVLPGSNDKIKRQ
jgi:hypothetical protein